jgi:hypothetical protein
MQNKDKWKKRENINIPEVWFESAIESFGWQAFEVAKYKLIILLINSKYYKYLL